MKKMECHVCKKEVYDVGGLGNLGWVCVACCIKRIEESGADPYKVFPKETVDKYKTQEAK